MDEFLHNQNFSDLFLTYATEDAALHSLLPTSMMEALIDYQNRSQKEIYLSFIGKDIFVAVTEPKDILEQQEKVARADGIVFIAPVIWMHYPAIMKGWIERVFSYGFAYALAPEGWQGSSKGRIPLLKLKKALSMNSTFFTEEDYQSKRFQDAMGKIIDDWSLRYPGIPEVEHVYFYAVAAVSEEKRKEYLEETYRLGKEF